VFEWGGYYGICFLMILYLKSWYWNMLESHIFWLDEDIRVGRLFFRENE
jgi:hypothetical protein